MKLKLEFAEQKARKVTRWKGCSATWKLSSRLARLTFVCFVFGSEI